MALKRRTKRILVFTTTLLVIILGNIWLDDRHYYELGENDTFEVATGEIFILKLDENGSTGYSYLLA